ncbi:MAG: YkgJ family cysteine cluster protein [Proteobacteria bacterium]|nr:YkgJ family cysteine cluster protein [Pseudomonadota bacterium]
MPLFDSHVDGYCHKEVSKNPYMDVSMIETIDRVTSFYADLDKMILQFQLKTGLRCPEKCGGICCQKEDVYISVIEMLPIAHAILIEGESAFWLEQLESKSPASRCIFYSQEPRGNIQGHCRQYTLRPMICRMFGFASVRNRLGEQKLSTCKCIKLSDKDAFLTATAIQSEAPCFSNISASLYGLEPSLSARLQPINEAFKAALSRVGLYLQLSHVEDLGGISVA